MTKVGLADTLKLLAAGYKKKDIDALAEIDEQASKVEETPPAPIITDSKPDKKDPEPEPEPDYKALYEELKKKNQETEAKVTKLQQDNIHKDSAPAAAEAKKAQEESLQELVRGFM